LQHQKLSNYAKYFLEKSNRETIEVEHGFVSYEIMGERVHVYDMWVNPDFRSKGIGHELMEMVINHAKNSLCTILTANVQLGINDCEKSLMAQLKYGFKIYSANQKEINLIKEII
jgi:GNAT superfamily N-acetyltransferase